MSQRQPTETITAEKVLASRMVAWPLTAMMSCPIGDGAAVAIVGRKELAKKLRPDRPVVSVVASTLRTRDVREAGISSRVRSSGRRR